MNARGSSREVETLTACSYLKGENGNELVTIAVEGSDREYCVQQAILCGLSENFSRALSGTYKEAKTRTLVSVLWSLLLFSFPLPSTPPLQSLSCS